MQAYERSAMRTRKYQAGFSLAELLVVLGIIGILLAILFASFQESREQSRNTAIRAGLKEVQLALETYKAQYGEYPPLALGSGCPNTQSVQGGAALQQSSDDCGELYIPGLVPDFMSALPMHTMSGASTCDIVYTVEASDAAAYKLTAAECVEGVTGAGDGIGQDDELARCPSSCPASGDCDPSVAAFYTSVAVYSNGAQCY